MRSLLDIMNSIDERHLQAARDAWVRAGDRHPHGNGGFADRAMRYAIAAYEYEKQLTTPRVDHAKAGEAADVDAGLMAP
jgi:hypothetical protein